MSMKNMFVNLPVQMYTPETLLEVSSRIDLIVKSLGGEVNSRQVLAVTVVLLERIEQLEKRLEANGIYL